VQFSVGMLKEYWQRSEALAVGESVGVLSIPQMPPWNDLCSELGWEFHTIEDGYFSAKDHGFWGVYRLIALAFEGDLTKPAVLNRLCGQDHPAPSTLGKRRV